MARPARAEPSPTDRADALFRQGLTLLEAERFEEACRTLEESLKLERAIGTLLNLARCYEFVHRPASAYFLYQMAALESENAGDHRRALLARQRGNAVDQRTPRVALILPDDEPSLQVAVDGKILERKVIRESMRMDPGPHTLEVQRPEEARGQLFTFRVPDRSDASATPIAIPVPTKSEGEEEREPSVVCLKESSQDTLQQEERGTPRATNLATSERSLGRTIAWSGLTVGAATLAAGIGVGTVALLNASAADCEDLECSAAGLEERTRAKTQLDVAYGLSIGGGLLALGSAAYLLLAAPKAPKTSRTIQPTAQFDLHGGRFGLSYRF